MSDAEGPGDQAGASRVHLAPIGKLGFRGRRATPKEQAQIMDAFFFEGGRRVPYLQQFFVLMVLSAAIAAFGLANDSAAVVIGAMLVAPLMTPILAVAAAIVQGWGRRAVESLAIITAGAISAIAVSFIIALFTPSLHTELPLPGELLARTAPNMIDLFIALAAGAAGGFVAVRTEASGALPGVGIAVALVPPLATVGITAGLGRWDLSAGALLLFLTNLVAIVLAAGLVFAGAGLAAYRDVGGQRSASWATKLVLVGVVVVTIPLLYHSLQRLDEANTTASVARDVRAWAPDLVVREVFIDRSSDPMTVAVTLTGPLEPPEADLLASTLASNFERAVHVDVAYVPLTGGDAPDPSP